MPSAQTTEKKSTAHIFLICALLFGIPAGACILEDDLVTGIALVAVGLSCYVGYRTGAIRALASVVGIVAAIYFAPQWASSVETFLAEKLSLSGLLNRGVSLGLVGLAIIVAVFLLGRLLCRLLLAKNGRGPINGLNQWGGFLMMGGEAVVAIALLLGGLLIISPEREELPAPTVSATLREKLDYQIKVVANETRTGKIGQLLKKHNPFVKFPQLNKFKEIQQTVRTVSDPAAMKQVITHPRIKELADKPSVQTAIDKLKSDETIREIIGSGEPLDREKMMRLLKSQVVLDLLDEPEFIKVASKIIAELDLVDTQSASSQRSNL
jgi:hypothetical protein